MDAVTTEAETESPVHDDAGYIRKDPTPAALQPDIATPDSGEPLVEEELLVEEVSIDGMCGVY